MQKFVGLLFLWVVTLSACSAIPAATPETPSPLPTTAIPDPKAVSTISTPHTDQGPDGAMTTVPPAPQNCGYQWAHQDLPELSSSFQQSLQVLQPQAQATAFGFGENCVLPDGSVAEFLPMETDFDITLQASDLNNDSDLGDWIVKVMQVIEEIPPDQIVGPIPGRISLTFQSPGQEKHVSFSINQYQALPSGLSAAEIFQQLQSPP